MVQDFAKIRPEPILDKRPAASPPAWSILFTGMLAGLAIGVFACVLLYLSGNVPPLQTTVQTVQSSREIGPENALDAATVSQAETPPADEDLEFEFYNTLPDYEVIVNATPVDIGEEPPVVAEQPVAASDGTYMLQIGAFERRANADSLRARIEALQLPAVVKEEPRTGRSLFLVQSGPFNSRTQLTQAELVLNASNIPNTRISLTTPAR